MAGPYAGPGTDGRMPAPESGGTGAPRIGSIDLLHQGPMGQKQIKAGNRKEDAPRAMQKSYRSGLVKHFVQGEPHFCGANSA